MGTAIGTIVELENVHTVGLSEIDLPPLIVTRLRGTNRVVVDDRLQAIVAKLRARPIAVRRIARGGRRGELVLGDEEITIVDFDFAHLHGTVLLEHLDVADNPGLEWLEAEELHLIRVGAPVAEGRARSGKAQQMRQIKLGVMCHAGIVTTVDDEDALDAVLLSKVDFPPGTKAGDGVANLRRNDGCVVPINAVGRIEVLASSWSLSGELGCSLALSDVGSG